jgi:hypothetical protein
LCTHGEIKSDVQYELVGNATVKNSDDVLTSFIPPNVTFGELSSDGKEHEVREESKE